MSARTPQGTEAADLADRLLEVVVGHVESFERRYAPGFDLPSVFAGYPVGSDVAADLAFTLAHLHDSGVATVAGASTVDAIAAALTTVEGSSTHTFSSYRVAETLLRFGPLDRNPLVAPLDPGRRAELVEACDSTSWIELLDGVLPANYAAVLARCELARRALGLPVDGAVVDDLVERTRGLLTRNPAGYLDDSEDGRSGRYDIYSVDVYLFTEAFADRLGPAWAEGFEHAVELVAVCGATDGSAVSWGRSLGPLAWCHTIEVAALVVRLGLGTDGRSWIARARRALDRFEDATDSGLVDAHRRRGQNGYRGPDRWLQLTFDCLGKLAWAATRLRAAEPLASAEAGTPFGDRDRLLVFDEATRAAVWSHRTPATGFAIPFVGPVQSDYLPAPRNPGLFEVPVDAPLPSFVPAVTARGRRYVAGGLPVALAHRDAVVEATWEGFWPLAADGPTADRASAPRPLAGCRRTRVSAQGHVVAFEEVLDFERVPDAVSIQVPEVEHRPLRLDVAYAGTARTATIDVEGLPAYRSFWHVLSRVHQVDLEPRPRMELTWSVRPLLRVLVGDPDHHYHRALYDPLARDVVESRFGGHLVHQPDRARELLSRADVFHLHWPEWFLESPDAAGRFVELLAETGTMLVWTQHNLRPHRELEGADELYQCFASAADVVIHHSEWGREAVTARYRFRPDAHHLVLPHGHWGPLLDDTADLAAARAAAEAELGLEPCAVRVGIVGAPRREKHVQGFLDAFAATSRPDLQLLVLSLDGEAVPDDPRITGRPYEYVARDVYNRRLAAVDVIALPFDADGEMLTTGVAADVVGLGLPAIVSSWPYLVEALGDAGIRYDDPSELTRLLDDLTPDRLETARRAAVGLRRAQSWDAIARRYFDELVALGAFRT